MNDVWAGVLASAGMIAFGYLLLVGTYVALEWLMHRPKKRKRP